jgi:TolB-like protein/DNA-binding SARP family transcriptional activator
MPALSCRLFGSPTLEDASGARVESLLAQPKRFAVLAYLVVEARKTPVSRDKVAAIFWPELDQSRARQALRQSLHVIRGELGDEVITGVGAEMVVLNQALVGSDVARFDDAIAAGDEAGALEAYRGHLLDGFFVSDSPEFDQWMSEARARHRTQAVAAAKKLAERADAAGNADEAVLRLQQQLALSDIDEKPLRRLMALLRTQGNAAAAIAAYDAYAERMHRELEVEPSSETAALAQGIRAEVAASGAPVGRTTTPYVPPGPLAAASRARLLGIGVVVAAAAILFAWRIEKSAASDAPPSVAVLPFLDLSAAKDQGYFSDGLTEELITTLSKVRGLKVTARTSSFRYRDARSDVPRIARELNVTSVLEGSVRRDGDRLRISAQLVDAGTGYHIWSENYDRKMSDVFAVQGEISRAIAGALKVELVGTPMLAERTTHRTAAYDAYLRGLYFWNQRNEASVRKAIDQFQAAIKEDSTYAAAWAGLADALQFAPTFEILRPDSAFPAALRAAQRALALDPESAEAHASFGYIKLHWERDWPGAEVELRRAIDLNPGYATAHQWMRIGYVAMGRFDDALAAVMRARELDPLSISILAAIGDTYMFAGRPAAAESAYTRALELSPEYDRAAVGLARARFRQGHEAEGIAMMEKALGGGERTNPYDGHLALMYGKAGRRADAERVLARLRSDAHRRFVRPFAFALAHAALGSADSARFWRNRTIAERDNWAVYVDAFPELKSIIAQR